MIVLTRQALYDTVWAEPVRAVAARFGISDVGLRKYCIRASIPVPIRGYWAKLAAGKKVAKSPLPPRDPGTRDEISIGKRTYEAYDPEKELAALLPEPPIFGEPIGDVKARVAKRVRKVPLIRDLADPNVSLRKMIEDDAKRAERQMTDRWPPLWDKPIFESGFEKRRLKVLNSLAVGLAKVGYRTEVRSKEARDLVVYIGDTHLKLTLDHPSAKQNRQGEWQTRPGPADTLRLVIGDGCPADGYRAVWSDADGAKLESQLTEIVIDVITAGEAAYRAASFQHHAWLLKRRGDAKLEIKRRQDEVARLARERRLAEEKARREYLLDQAKAWRAAQDIRSFVAEIVSSAAANDGEASIRAWADWALTEADALDPVKQRRLDLPRQTRATSGGT